MAKNSNIKRFGYLIKEIHPEDKEPLEFSVPSSSLYLPDYKELITKQAAYVHFYGEGGWRCEHGWPLTFKIVFLPNKNLLTTSIVFIMSGEDPPEFEVV